ncbi:MAG: DNA polymerase IV [Clostridia bacterium]|nr:DNA polymerase IV [Clostridia bacterium]
MKPLIFHCDCNNFFASCECLTNPALRDVPMAVAGDPENRVGIVVAKNQLAKLAGVRTTDTVWQARKKCPNIVFVTPRHRFYKEISDKVNAIYHEYTDYVEPASIDESYLDMTGAPEYYKLSERALADRLRARVKDEIGITISVGVSYNKIFAKMGSDYKKPDATTVITPENYKDILWPLPVSDLMFVGRATAALLGKKGITTIGELAQLPRAEAVALLGQSESSIWDYANGLDEGTVKPWGYRESAKSVSHGMTFKRNLVTEEEVRTGVSYLADRVASSLRFNGQKGAVVSVSIKSPELKLKQKQTALEHYTWLQHEIADVSMQLINDFWRIGEQAPIRAITIGISKLIMSGEETEQVSLLGDEESEKRKKQDKIESAIAALRRKTGSKAVTLGFGKNEDIGIK